LLLLASIWSWAIIFDKMIRLRGLRSKARKFEESFWSGGSLEELFDRIANRPIRFPMASIFRRRHARMAALGRQGPAHHATSLKESLQDRIERVMNITLGREMDQLETLHGGSSPRSARPHPSSACSARSGGIMTSFAGHRRHQEYQPRRRGTPASPRLCLRRRLVSSPPFRRVLAYNKLSGDIGRYGNRLEAFSGEFGAILSRQLEEKH